MKESHDSDASRDRLVPALHGRAPIKMRLEGAFGLSSAMIFPP